MCEGSLVGLLWTLVCVGCCGRAVESWSECSLAFNGSVRPASRPRWPLKTSRLPCPLSWHWCPYCQFPPRSISFYQGHKARCGNVHRSNSASVSESQTAKERWHHDEDVESHQTQLQLSKNLQPNTCCSLPEKLKQTPRPAQCNCRVVVAVISWRQSSFMQVVMRPTPSQPGWTRTDNSRHLVSWLLSGLDTIFCRHLFPKQRRCRQNISEK